MAGDNARMSDANTTRALWQIHLCVLLWGFTAILGKLITLPALPLVWWPAVFGLVAHVGFALYSQYVHKGPGRLINVPGWDWAIPTPTSIGWPAIGASIGGMAGIGLSSLLLAKGTIKRSFHDYEEWEKKHLAKPAAVTSVGGEAVAEATEAPATLPTPAAPETSQDQADLWTQYPHARREMIRVVPFCL